MGQLGCLDLFLFTWSSLLREVNPGWVASQSGGSMLSPGVCGDQASACSADVPLAKPSHEFKPKVDVGGDCISADVSRPDPLRPLR